MAAPPPPKQIKVDHASVCGSKLDVLQKEFAAAGLTPDYGGPHAHGGTQMALLGFEDGSYLELIAPKDGQTAGDSSWAEMIAGDAGPCAWAIGTTTLKEDLDELKARGLSVEGPSAGSRARPDGTVIRWETGGVRDRAPGAILPFMIQDKTPRELRVRPSASVKGSGLKGIEIVVIGVKDLDAAVALFRRAYGWSAPQFEEHKEFGARLAYFPGTPVMLTASWDKESWLADRLLKFGDSPAAYLLGAHDLKDGRFRLTPGGEWFGKKVSWFEAKSLGGIHLGVIQ